MPQGRIDWNEYTSQLLHGGDVKERGDALPFGPRPYRPAPYPSAPTPEPTPVPVGMTVISYERTGMGVEKTIVKGPDRVSPNLMLLAVLLGMVGFAWFVHRLVAFANSPPGVEPNRT